LNQEIACLIDDLAEFLSGHVRAYEVPFCAHERHFAKQSPSILLQIDSVFTPRNEVTRVSLFNIVGRPSLKTTTTSDCRGYDTRPAFAIPSGMVDNLWITAPYTNIRK